MRHVIWSFPLMIIGVVALLYQVGASQLTRSVLKQKLAEQYGVSDATVEYYAGRLPQGWQIGDRIQLEPDPHEHDWRAGIGVVNDDDTGVVSNFAHMGDGDFPGQDEPLQTGYVMVNNSLQPASGMIHFFADNGDPLELTVDGVTDSSFPFALNPGQIKRLTTDGVGELKGGWTRIRSDQPIVVTSNFGAIRKDGTVITDVGVGESELGTKFTIFADTISSNDTGVAVSNADDEQAIDIQLTLRTAAGEMVGQEMIHLEPRGHLARFLNQLFPEVDGIDEFEGTVVLASQTPAAVAGGSGVGQAPAGEASLLPFAGLTLRISGTVFTSVPMVPPLPPGADFTRLAFPQAADGQAGELKVSTTPVLFNLTDQTASGIIEFFKGDGSLNQVGVGGVAVSAIPFQIPPGGVFRVDTDGVGELAVGWARVTMDQPLSGLAIFTIRDSSGVVAAVGVEATQLFQNLEMIADTTGIFNTAMALVNPLTVADGSGDPVRVTIRLLDASGLFIASTTLELGPLQHTAQFLTEFFPEVNGIDEFFGRVQISVSGSNDYLAPLSLRSAAEKLTSVPVFVEQHGFAPSALLQFAQNLAGTAPAVRLTLHQNGEDTALEFIRIRLSGIDLQLDNFVVGRQFGSGSLSSPQRIVLFAGREPDSDPESSIGFDMVSASQSNIGFSSQAEGTISRESTGDIFFDLHYLNNQPNSFVGIDTNIIVFLDENLFATPAAGGVTAVSEFISVSLTSSEERRILRRTQQNLSFEPHDPQRANIELVQPFQLVAGEIIKIVGTNLGSEPQLLFPIAGGQDLVTFGFFDETGELLAFVPEGVVDGVIRVDNGLGPGNGYLTKSLFGPEVEVQLGEEEGSFTLHFTQDANLYPMELFDAYLRIDSASLEALAVDQMVGAFNQDPNLNFFVLESAPGSALLQVGRELNTNVTGEVRLEVIEEGNRQLLRMTYEPISFPLVIDFLSGPAVFDVGFVGLPITLPAPGNGIIVSGIAVSGPTSVDGRDSALRSPFQDAVVRN